MESGRTHVQAEGCCGLEEQGEVRTESHSEPSEGTALFTLWGQTSGPRTARPRIPVVKPPAHCTLLGKPRTLAPHQCPLPAAVGLTLTIRLSFQEDGERFDSHSPYPLPAPRPPGLHGEICF